MFSKANIIAFVLAAGSVVNAHPGEVHDILSIREDIKVRDILATQHKRSLAACANTLKARELTTRAVTRRAAKAEKLRAARGIDASSMSYHFYLPFLSC